MLAPAGQGARSERTPTCSLADYRNFLKSVGFAGMQFSAVAESNHAAVEIYKRLGFTIVGTVPGAFAHPILGHVGLHVMYRAL
jgi:hypothetical protein